MINQLDIEIHDSRGYESIRYTHGVRLIEYVAKSNTIRVYLSDDYEMQDKSLLQDYNESCEPYQHRYSNVEYISVC